MSDESRLITNRLREVKAESERLRSQLAANDAEIAELEMAAKVIARLTGAAGSEAVTADAEPAARPSKPDGIPSMPDMIVQILERAPAPMEPREVTEMIRLIWWPEAVNDRVASIMWRMQKRGQVAKVDGTSSYILPREEGDSPPKEREDASEELDGDLLAPPKTQFQPAPEGVEGGGT